MESVSLERFAVTPLRDAWDRWEHAPGDPKSAERMVDACVSVAATVGMDYRTFRQRLQVLRRQGYTIDQVVTKINRKAGSTGP